MTLKYKILYQSVESYSRNSKQVDEIIEKDTGVAVFQTKSIPPVLLPVELSQPAVKRLKEIEGMKIQEVDVD